MLQVLIFSRESANKSKLINCQVEAKKHSAGSTLMKDNHEKVLGHPFPSCTI